MSAAVVVLMYKFILKKNWTDFMRLKTKKPYYVQIRKPLMKTIDLHWENNSEFRNL